MNVIIICMSILKNSVGEITMKIGYDICCSPIGLIHVVVDEIGVKKIELFEENWYSYISNKEEIEKNTELCKDTIIQLDEYFRGDRQCFTLPLSIEGTKFRKRVWQELQNIPYGEVRSYKNIAKKIGNDKAVRAVGQANKNNQIPIIIPCHRVIGKNGNLVGFAGDKVKIQEVLLNHEKRNIK